MNLTDNDKREIAQLIQDNKPLPDKYRFLLFKGREEIELLWKLVSEVIKLKKISKKGFRIISNSGVDGNQDVPHFHIHLLGGKNLGRMMNL